ncbi:MAG: C45 family peptidase [bacterium]|nr:C45 family peptidase [bacterium]
MLKLFTVSGAPYELGFQLGQKARTYIRAGAEFYRAHWKEMTGISWNLAMKLLQPSMALTAKLLPDTLAELHGMSKGSGVPWRDMFIINSMEALEYARPKKEKCTSIIARSRGQILLAHNEDWVAKDRDFLYMVRARPNWEPEYMYFGEGAWMQTYGLNSVGIGFVADSFTARDARRTGISPTFLGKEIMRCSTLSAAVKRITSLPRADGHAYVIISPDDGVVVETTATRHSLLSLQKKQYLAHTNFYQAAALRTYEQSVRSYSRFRCLRVRELLDAKTNRVIREKELFDILSDHENYPQSICCHVGQEARNPVEDQTIASVIIDPCQLTMTVRHGNPCHAVTQKFHL